MSIFIEPLENQPHLVVLGAGHIGLALSRLGLTMDFQVTLADPRQRQHRRIESARYDCLLRRLHSL